MIVLTLAFVGCGGSGADESEPTGDESAAAASEGTLVAVQNGVGQATEAQIAAYPLDTCVVSGESLGSMGEPVDYFVEGELVRLCCDQCIDQVKEEPQKFLAKVAEASAGSSDTE